MHTTLNKIKMFSPPRGMWEALLASFGNTQADDHSIALADILKLQGLYTATWCLRTIPEQDAQIRLFAIACERAMPAQFIKPRAHEILEVAERFAHAKASPQELEALWSTHWDAASGSIMATARPDAAQGALTVIRCTATDLEWETEMEGAWSGLSLAEQKDAAQKACHELQARQTTAFITFFTSSPIDEQVAANRQSLEQDALQEFTGHSDKPVSPKATSMRPQ